MLMYVIRGKIEDKFFIADKCVFIGPEDQCAAYIIRNKFMTQISGKSLCMTSGNGIGLTVNMGVCGIKNNDVFLKAYRSKK